MHGECIKETNLTNLSVLGRPVWHCPPWLQLLNYNTDFSVKPQHYGRLFLNFQETLTVRFKIQSNIYKLTQTSLPPPSSKLTLHVVLEFLYAAVFPHGGNDDRQSTTFLALHQSMQAFFLVLHHVLP